jgi:hypothetical protein
VKYYVGVDVGVSGGIGIIDRAGDVVGAHRWQGKNPVLLYNLLSIIRGLIDNIYIELVQTFPQKDSGFQNKNQGLLVNLGVWQGWCMALGLPAVLVSPLTWQAAFGLTHWQARKSESPLELARRLWPGAPLEFKVDDGKAVGLLLAELSRRDSLAGFDRAAVQVQKKEKEKLRRKAARVKVKPAGDRQSCGL